MHHHKEDLLPLVGKELKKTGGKKINRSTKNVCAISILLLVCFILCLTLILSFHILRSEVREDENLIFNSNKGNAVESTERNAKWYNLLQTQRQNSKISFQQMQPTFNRNNVDRTKVIDLPQCTNPPQEKNRFDCLPDPQSNPENACKARGCCWMPARQQGAPWCFFPQNFPSYKQLDTKATQWGWQSTLNKTSASSIWPKEIQRLQLDVRYETSTRLRFQIYDPSNDRYRVPVETPNVATQASRQDYTVKYQSNPFGISVIRTSTGQVLFNSSVAPLIFADQFIQISTLQASHFFYGLGEHRRPFLWDTSSWQHMSFWARDQPPTVQTNLYGDHPFYLGMESDGNSHGVYLLNSNAMEIDIQPAPAITYRTIGGILDFYIFLGPTPADVVQQYLDVIGYPTLPPYWSLGFHLCRWGYGGSDGLKKVIKRMRDADFPYETQWNDIDYMDRHLDWTYDNKKFSDLPVIVKDLHDNGQHYVMIVDPGISNTQPNGSYSPYDDGLKQGVFITQDKSPLVGKVWPGCTVYPDFFNPKASEWWYAQAKTFHDAIPFDGLWTDMNEPSNFVSGSLTGCPTNTLNNPPYTPKILGGKLSDKTVCPSATQHISTHYNLHSLYGHSEAVATNQALIKIRNKRPFVITRSSFASTGKYAGHWTGDNYADWNNLYWSIPGVLNFQLFGIPMVGADICGFMGDTTEELCTRWMQLGAFYPFMRNHNTLQAVDQDPAVFSQDAQKAMKTALNIRYTLLPYLYSLFVRSHMNGTIVARPLFFKYPKDSETYKVDKQFMWGDGLMICPALTKGASFVTIYFPDDFWYDYYTGNVFRSGGVTYTNDSPLDKIVLHIRGGSILPTQSPKKTTLASRNQPFGLLIGLDSNDEAQGELFWDDGDSLNTTEKGLYSHFIFTVKNSVLASSIEKSGYKPSTGLTLENCKVMGVSSKPDKVYANGQSVPFNYVDMNAVLTVSGLTLDLFRPITITWK